MKKLLLLSASALLSFSAMAQVTEPTLTKAWDTKGTIPTARFATAYNGTIYALDHAATKIIAVTENDATDFVTNALLKGVAITCDSNGNLIVNKMGAGNSTAISNWAVVPVNNKENITELTLTAPTDNYTAGRIDAMGRFIGDVTKNAVFYATPVNNTRAFYVKINSGVSTATCSTEALTTDYQTTTYKAWGSTSALAQAVGTYDEISALENPEDCCIIRDRSVNKLFYFENKEVKTVKLPSNVGTACAFDAVKLNGVVYYILPTKNTSGTAYGTGFVVFDGEGNVVAEETKSDEGDNQTSIIAEKVSDTKANIYHYVMGKKASMYTFEVPEVSTAIESVAVDANAPVEYYNLQGVKVANPENGLFIKKQGNKATKVIL